MHHVALIILYAFALLCTAYTLFQLFSRDIDMSFSKTIFPLLFGSFVAAQNSSVDLNWYAPKKSWINDLGQVINGTGTNGFVFSGSKLPDGVEYGTYNWCNMPHVRKDTYVKADKDFELVYVEM